MTPATSSFIVGGPDERGQSCVRSRACFSAGETLLSFSSMAVYDQPAQMTVQISEHQHIILAPEFLSYLNHSCAPSVRFDVEKMLIIALRPIAVDDELTFFYPETEWHMASPFVCSCGAAHCLGMIAGASQVPESQLARYQLAPHITRLLLQRRAQSGSGQGQSSEKAW